MAKRKYSDLFTQFNLLNRVGPRSHFQEKTWEGGICNDTGIPGVWSCVIEIETAKQQNNKRLKMYPPWAEQYKRRAPASRAGHTPCAAPATRHTAPPAPTAAAGGPTLETNCRQNIIKKNFKHENGDEVHLVLKTKSKHHTFGNVRKIMCYAGID